MPASSCAYQSRATSWRRPPTNATYCDSNASTGSPFTVIVTVSGSSVVSVRKSSPSTLPSSTALCRSAIGNQGLSTAVGSENVGVSRSTRADSGATGRPAVSGLAGSVAMQPAHSTASRDMDAEILAVVVMGRSVRTPP